MKRKPHAPLKVRLTPSQSEEARAIADEASKVNSISISANSVATMACGIGLPEVRRKLTTKG